MKHIKYAAVTFAVLSGLFCVSAKAETGKPACSGARVLPELIIDVSGIRSPLTLYEVFELEKTKATARPMLVIEFRKGWYQKHAGNIVDAINNAYGAGSARFALPADYASGAIPQDVVPVVIPAALLSDTRCVAMPPNLGPALPRS